MGQLHNELRRSPISAALQNAVSDTKGEGGVERYGETLTPNIDLWRMPEWYWLRKERLCSSSRTQAAGAAGQFGGIGICNPLNTGIIIVVDTWTGILSAAADNAPLLLATDAAIAALFTSSSQWLVRDTRWGGLSAGIGVVRQGTNAAAPTSIQLDNAIQQANVNFMYQVGLPVVLHPGFGLIAISNNDASSITMNIGGRERLAFKNELP